MLAEFTLIGRIGKIFDRRSDDTPVSFGLSVATEDSWRDDDGQWHNKTYWHYVTVMSGRETLANKLFVGDRIHARGNLRPWQTQGEDGQSDTRRGIDMVLQERKIVERSKKRPSSDRDESADEQSDNSEAA